MREDRADIQSINKIAIESLKSNDLLEQLYCCDIGIEDWDREFEEFLNEE